MTVVDFYKDEFARAMALVAALAMACCLAAMGTDRAVAGKRAAIGPCSAITRLVDGVDDAGPALQTCIEATPPGGTIALPRGRYLIATPIHIRRPITLTTRTVSPTAAPCAQDERRCATLHLAIATALMANAVMPFDIDSNAVRLDHLVFEGTRRTDPLASRRRCTSDSRRPMEGGLRVSGNAVVITRSVFRDMACYTALEYGGGAGVLITDNAFSGNGTHTVALGWADGLTIHTAKHFTVTGNWFRDNTDVQLIFGSCVDCRIADNHFSHSEAAEGGSFAELMLQAWPNVTSGDFTGTLVTHNAIDCGSKQRCGFGIMIGSAPWYDAPAFGGTVVKNHVRGAMLALNVDYLTGPMRIEHNDLAVSSGTYSGMCGPQRVSAARWNVSPRSRPFLSSTTTDDGATFTHHCILNYTIVPPE